MPAAQQSYPTHTVDPCYASTVNSILSGFLPALIGCCNLLLLVPKAILTPCNLRWWLVFCL